MEVGGPFDEVCRYVLAATSQLLGSTISFSEDDWAQDSMLPGWTRAHVAAHLAENAEGLRRLVTGVIEGHDEVMYSSEERRAAAIESGAARDPLSLQIALDTSAGQLANATHALPADRLHELVSLPSGNRVAVRLVPLIRLSELIMHHTDLRAGFSLIDVDLTPILWCLELRAAMLRGRREYPPLRLIAHEGLDVTTGRDAAPEIVRSDARSLLGWLTGRVAPPEVARRPWLPLL